MVVDDNNVDPLGAELRDGADGDGAAVNGDEEVGALARGAFFHAAFEGGFVEAVTFGGATGDEALRVESVGLEDFFKDGDGAGAIDIVVTVDDNAFLLVDGLEETRGSELHLGNEEGVGEIFEPGAEKGLYFGRIGETSLGEDVLEAEGELALGLVGRGFKEFPKAGA